MSHLNKNKHKNLQGTATKKITSRPTSKQPSIQSVLQRAQHQPHTIGSDDILQLQRTLGDQATQNVIQRYSLNQPAIQRKGFWGKAFDRMFGVDAVRQKRQGRLKKAGNLGKKTRLEKDAVPIEYYRQRIREQREVREFVIERGRSARGIKRSGNYTGKKPSLGAVLGDPMARAIFKSFCEKESATENYIFFDMVVDMNKDFANLERQSNQWVKPLRMGEAIWISDNLIQNYKTYSVNLSNSTRNKVLNAVQQMKNTIEESNQMSSTFGSSAILTSFVPSNVQQTFVTAFGEIHHRMSDTYTSFRTKDEVFYAMVAMNEGLGWQHETKRTLFDPIVGHAPTRRRR